MQILYEDSEILACYKEAGTAVQSSNIRVSDLESRLRLYLSQRGIPHSALHVVHRLDQPVQGLVLFGLTAHAASVLGKELTDGSMKKTYLALVECAALDGRKLLEKAAAGEEISLEDDLLRDGRTNTSRIVRAGTPGAKKAALTFTAAEFDEESARALLKISLKTGRHHQIRVQLAGAGLPIIGDRRYGKESQQYKFPCLCAWKLSFKHPLTGREMELEVPEELIVFTERREGPLNTSGHSPQNKVE